ncbi:MAG: UDP-glucose 4-epimerase GalE [Bauldia sp.]
MRILVTGGAGYIGSHTCKALAGAGHEPVVYDNLVRGHEWAVRWGPLERGDILDTERLAAVLRKHRPSAVIHFAAFAYVGESVDDPAKYYRNNVVGTLSLLDAMRASRVDKLVFSSTCATYGLPRALPLSEGQPQMPINAYGQTKLAIERALADYGRAYGLRSIALRYFNAAGADPDGALGEQHDPETHLLPLLLQVAAGLRDCVTVHGDDYETPDGTCIRDFVHVSDLADAHVLALDALGEKGGLAAYNLGMGRGSSVREIIGAVEDLTGRKVRCQIGPRRTGDPPILFADAALARRELGWEPRHSDLARIIETAWNWTNARAALRLATRHHG